MRNLSVIKGLYQGNGVTRRWAIPFEYNDTAQIFVTITTFDEGDYTYRVLDSTEYTIDEDSVEIVYPKTVDDEPIPNTQYLTVWRDTDLLQLMDLTNQGAAWPDSIEASLDKLHQIVQELAEGLSRSLKVDIGDPQTPDEKLVAIQDYVLAAAESSRSASASEASAQRAAEAAATSEANAAESERLAGGYADTTSDAASRAEDSAISARAYNAPDYDNAVTYQAGDVVTFTDGNSYRALQETTGNEPPNIIYWQKVTDYVGDDFFEVDEYGYIVPMDSPSHSRYWRVDQNGYIVPIEGGDGGYRPDTRYLSSEYLNVTNDGYVKHFSADDIAADEVDADEVTAVTAAFTTASAGTLRADDATITELAADNVTADTITVDTVTPTNIIAKNAKTKREYVNDNTYGQYENGCVVAWMANVGENAHPGVQGDDYPNYYLSRDSVTTYAENVIRDMSINVSSSDVTYTANGFIVDDSVDLSAVKVGMICDAYNSKTDDVNTSWYTGVIADINGKTVTLKNNWTLQRNDSQQSTTGIPSGVALHINETTKFWVHNSNIANNRADGNGVICEYGIFNIAGTFGDELGGIDVVTLQGAAQYAYKARGHATPFSYGFIAQNCAEGFAAKLNSNSQYAITIRNGNDLTYWMNADGVQSVNKLNIQVMTTNGQISDNVSVCIVINGGLTVTLPALTSKDYGKILKIISLASCEVQAPAGVTLANKSADNKITLQKDNDHIMSVELITDGTSWFVTSCY